MHTHVVGFLTVSTRCRHGTAQTWVGSGGTGGHTGGRGGGSQRRRRPGAGWGDAGVAKPAKSTRRGTVATKTQTYNGYCVKCKEKRDFEGTVEVSKTGMNMAKGKCPVCGTTVNRILGKAK